MKAMSATYSRPNQPKRHDEQKRVSEGGGRFDFIFVPCKMCFHFQFDKYKTVFDTPWVKNSEHI